jgi:hypothetical protein
MTDFGTKGYATIEPNNGIYEEQITFTGLTQNAGGTCTLSGVSTVLFKTPYTETSGLAKAHAGGVKLVITNTAKFYDDLASPSNDETVSGQWTFSLHSPAVPTETSSDVTHAASIEYVNNVASFGAPDASTTVKGIAKLTSAPVSATNPIVVAETDTRLPTQNENDALVGTSGTAVSSSNKLVDNADTATTVTPGIIVRRLATTGGIALPTTPTDTTDATSKAYVDTAIGTRTALTTFRNNGTAHASIRYTGAKNSQITFNTDGSVMYALFYSGTNGYSNIQRFVRTTNGNYVPTAAAVNVNLQGASIDGNSESIGFSLVGNYLYVSYEDTGGLNPTYLTRMDEATLGNVTNMTYSGTTLTHGTNRTSFSDGTNLYIHNTTTSWLKYSLSGTVATYVASVTIAGTTNALAAYYTGGFVYILTNDTNTIIKSNLTGTVSATPVFYFGAEGTGNGIGAYGTNLLIATNGALNTSYYSYVYPHVLF